MTHPLALTGHRNGANGMSAGDRVRYRIDGRTISYLMCKGERNDRYR